MDAYCFAADHAERDGAADDRSIGERWASKPGASECCGVANDDRASDDGSTGCIAAHQPGLGGRNVGSDGSADDHG